jgi:hypothetical protein
VNLLTPRSWDWGSRQQSLDLKHSYLPCSSTTSNSAPISVWTLQSQTPQPRITESGAMTAIGCTRSVSVFFSRITPPILYTNPRQLPSLLKHLRQEWTWETQAAGASCSRQMKQGSLFRLCVVPSHAIFPPRTQQTKIGQPCTKLRVGGDARQLLRGDAVWAGVGRIGSFRRLLYFITSYRSNLLLIFRLVRCGELM